MQRPLATMLCLVSLAAAGGCTLLVGAELSDKPAETAADGGEGGSGASTSSGPTSSGGPSSGGPSSGGPSSGGSTSGGSTSSSSGALMCPPNMANCDGIPAHGCDVNLQNDPEHCGSCANVCKPPMLVCAGGKCK